MASLAANALVTLAALKGDLKIDLADTSQDVALIGRINAASDAVENFCDRKFTLRAELEDLSAPVTRSPKLRLKRIPVRREAAVSVTVSNGINSAGTVLVAGQDFVVEDYDRGRLFRPSRWSPTALRQPGIVQDYESSTEQRSITATFIGGYVTQPMLDAATAWPSSTDVDAGALIIPAGHTNQVWMCTVAGTTGGSEPGWAVTPKTTTKLRVGSSLVDGSVTWSYVGTVDGTGAAAKTLPGDLELATLQTAVAMMTTQGQDTNIKSESLMSYSVSFGDRTSIPPTAVQMLMQYKRPTVA